MTHGTRVAYRASAGVRLGSLTYHHRHPFVSVDAQNTDIFRYKAQINPNAHPPVLFA
jgi:hypothetical protein